MLCAGSTMNFPPDVSTKTVSREIGNPCRAQIPEVRELNVHVYICAAIRMYIYVIAYEGKSS